MIKKSLVPASLAVAGFVALAGCSSGARTQTISVAPAATMSPAPAAATAPEVSPGLIRKVQTTLQQQGFYKGHIDGVWGPQTQGAIHSYQQARNLTVNGELDSKTLASLNAPSDTSAPPVPVAMAPAPPPATAPTAPPAATVAK